MGPACTPRPCRPAPKPASAPQIRHFFISYVIPCFSVLAAQLTALPHASEFFNCEAWLCDAPGGFWHAQGDPRLIPAQSVSTPRRKTVVLIAVFTALLYDCLLTQWPLHDHLLSQCCGVSYAFHAAHGPTRVKINRHSSDLAVRLRGPCVAWCAYYRPLSLNLHCSCNSACGTRLAPALPGLVDNLFI